MQRGEDQKVSMGKVAVENAFKKINQRSCLVHVQVERKRHTSKLVVLVVIYVYMIYIKL